jgi:hypothetical protein
VAKTLKQLLGYAYLTDVVQAIKTGIPKFYPDEFDASFTPVFADAVRHIRVGGTRKVAKQSIYGAPARRVVLSGLSDQDIKLVHLNEEISLPIQDFMSLREHANYNVQQLGIQEITRQAQQFRARFDNHRIAATTSVLANGKIWYDSDGDLLPTSSGASVTIDFSVPANNLNQLNGIIGVSWATASAEIITDINQIHDVALQTSGYSLENGWGLYGINIPSYLASNTQAKEFLARNPGYNQRFIDTGEIPNGFMRLNWKRMSGAFYNDDDDTKQTMWGVDQITFTPPVSKAWWDPVEGSYPLPTTYGVMSSLEGAAESFDFRYGIASYAYPVWTPPTANIVYVDTVLPWLKVPAAVFIADVTP